MNTHDILGAMVSPVLVKGQPQLRMCYIRYLFSPSPLGPLLYTHGIARFFSCLGVDGLYENRSVFGPEEAGHSVPMAVAGAAGGEGEGGLEAVTTRRIVKARGYGGLAPGEALARALGVAIALGCISPRRLVISSTASGACHPGVCMAFGR